MESARGTGAARMRARVPVAHRWATVMRRRAPTMLPVGVRRHTALTTAVGNRRAALSTTAGAVIISRKATVPFKHASFYESLSNKSVKSVLFRGVPPNRHHATAGV